ncbi:MAG: glycine--tRNA ligase, partial [Parcubacteria group bacterium]
MTKVPDKLPKSSVANVANVAMDTLVALAKRRGFVYPGSEIYGGLANAWDYGPLGVEMRRNIKNLWWKRFVQEREDIIGLESAVLMNPRVWEASGHVSGFTDQLVECKNCHERFRVDQIDLKKACAKCGKKDQFTPARHFNLMFKTYIGPSEEQANVAYLRP